MLCIYWKYDLIFCTAKGARHYLVNLRKIKKPWKQREADIGQFASPSSSSQRWFDTPRFTKNVCTECISIYFTAYK